MIESPVPLERERKCAIGHSEALGITFNQEAARKLFMLAFEQRLERKKSFYMVEIGK